MLVLNIVFKGSGLQVLVGRRPHSFLGPVCTLTKTGLAFKHPEKYLYTGFLKNPNKENKNCATIQPRKTLKSPCLDPEP